jgi:hypothetical protein
MKNQGAIERRHMSFFKQRTPDNTSLEDWDTFEFVPAPDITAYELACLD